MVRIFLFYAEGPLDDEGETIVDVDGDKSASFIAQETFFGFEAVSRLVRDAELVLVDGPTGVATEEIVSIETTVWRACTIAFRMGQGSRDVSVPTL